MKPTGVFGAPPALLMPSHTGVSFGHQRLGVIAKSAHRFTAQSEMRPAVSPLAPMPGGIGLRDAGGIGSHRLVRMMSGVNLCILGMSGRVIYEF